MPHIVISVLEGIPYQQKRQLAADIARVVAEDVGLPFEMVTGEVSFQEISLENCSPAVEFTKDNPPLPVQYVSLSILRGRPLEQKRKLVRDITEIIANSIRVSPETQEIAIEINEVDPANIAHGGILTIDMENPPLTLE